MASRDNIPRRVCPCCFRDGARPGMNPAQGLIARSSEGTIRAVKNLCIGAMVEAVRDQTKTIDTKHINAVLLQPHWRHNQQHEPK